MAKVEKDLNLIPTSEEPTAMLAAKKKYAWCSCMMIIYSEYKCCALQGQAKHGCSKYISGTNSQVCTRYIAMHAME